MANVKLIAATILLLQRIRSSYGWLPPLQRIVDRSYRSSGSQSASSKHRCLRIVLPSESNTRRYQNAGSQPQQERRQSEEAVQCPFPPNPLLHLETIIQFDVIKYPLRERVLAVLGIEPSIDLSTLHEHSDRYLDKSGNSVNEVQVAWNANRNREQRSRDQSVLRFVPHDAPLQYERFDEVYQALIRDVVAPAMGGGRILFQRAPTLRVMSPLSTDPSSSSSAPASVMSKLHNDCDYHHQPSEINFWLPLTNEVFDSNSLWVESSPGLGDFHPLELKYGQVTRFYGNQCRHYASDNRTGISRVSIDFRAVSDDSGGHNPLFRKGVRRGAKARYKDVFDVPDFYSEVTVPKYEIANPE
jgi:hypothetical protein